MALIKCNGCGRMISNRASFCPHCGYKVQGSLESKTEEQSNLINNECSRLSRRIVDFLQVIEQLTDKGISLFILQNSLETLQADGKPNPIAQLVLGMIAQFNSMERGLIRSRMESGYNHYRSNDGKVGRKTGYRKSQDDMREEYAEEIRLLKKGISLRNICKITHTSVNTLRKIRDLTTVKH